MNRLLTWDYQEQWNGGELVTTARLRFTPEAWVDRKTGKHPRNFFTRVTIHYSPDFRDVTWTGSFQTRNKHARRHDSGEGFESLGEFQARAVARFYRNMRPAEEVVT